MRIVSHEEITFVWFPRWVLVLFRETISRLLPSLSSRIFQLHVVTRTWRSAITIWSREHTGNHIQSQQRRSVASDIFIETCVITRKFATDHAFLKLQGTISKQLSGRNFLARTTASAIFTDYKLCNSWLINPSCATYALRKRSAMWQKINKPVLMHLFVDLSPDRGFFFQRGFNRRLYVRKLGAVRSNILRVDRAWSFTRPLPMWAEGDRSYIDIRGTFMRERHTLYHIIFKKYLKSM